MRYIFVLILLFCSVLSFAEDVPPILPPGGQVCVTSLSWWADVWTILNLDEGYLFDCVGGSFLGDLSVSAQVKDSSGVVVSTKSIFCSRYIYLDSDVPNDDQPFILVNHPKKTFTDPVCFPNVSSFINGLKMSLMIPNQEDANGIMQYERLLEFTVTVQINGFDDMGNYYSWSGCYLDCSDCFFFKLKCGGVERYLFSDTIHSFSTDGYNCSAGAWSPPFVTSDSPICIDIPDDLSGGTGGSGEGGTGGTGGGGGGGGDGGTTGEGGGDGTGGGGGMGGDGTGEGGTGEGGDGTGEGGTGGTGGGGSDGDDSPFFNRPLTCAMDYQAGPPSGETCPLGQRWWWDKVDCVWFCGDESFVGDDDFFDPDVPCQLTAAPVTSCPNGGHWVWKGEPDCTWVCEGGGGGDGDPPPPCQPTAAPVTSCPNGGHWVWKGEPDCTWVCEGGGDPDPPPPCEQTAKPVMPEGYDCTWKGSPECSWHCFKVGDPDGGCEETAKPSSPAPSGYEYVWRGSPYCEWLLIPTGGGCEPGSPPAQDSCPGGNWKWLSDPHCQWTCVTPPTGDDPCAAGAVACDKVNCSGSTLNCTPVMCEVDGVMTTIGFNCIKSPSEISIETDCEDADKVSSQKGNAASRCCSGYMTADANGNPSGDLVSGQELTCDGTHSLTPDSGPETGPEEDEPADYYHSYSSVDLELPDTYISDDGKKRPFIPEKISKKVKDLYDDFGNRIGYTCFKDKLQEQNNELGEFCLENPFKELGGVELPDWKACVNWDELKDSSWASTLRLLLLCGVVIGFVVSVIIVLRQY
jgi:hypothetical protein